MYFDMLYGVNNIDLGINVILQLMELNFGEGKLEIIYIFFIFINILHNFKGHFGSDYPWHTKILEDLAARLEILSRPLDKPAKISLRIWI